MQPRELSPDCPHKRWIRAGRWDSKDTETNMAVSGARAECTKCRGSKRFFWPEWYEQEKKQRAAE